MNKYDSSTESQPVRAPKSFNEFDGFEMAQNMVAARRPELSGAEKMDKALQIAPHIQRLVNHFAERDEYEGVAQKVDSMFDENISSKS